MSVQIRSNYGNIDTGKLIPAYSDIVAYAEGIPANILANSFNVKYICKVFIDGVVVATLKAPPNSNINNKALFRVQSILQDHTETDKRNFRNDNASSTFEGVALKPHSIHQIDRFARNRSNYRRVNLQGGYEYAATLGGDLIENISISSLEFFIWNAVYQHNQGIDLVTPNEHVLDSNTSKFLTLFPNLFDSTNVFLSAMQKIQLDQFHTIAFFNGKVYGSSDDADSDVAKIRVITYDSSSAVLATTDIDNTTDNGGFGGVLDKSETKLLYCGVGTGNLSNIGVSFTNVAYYSVHAIDSGGTQVSAQYHFRILNADCRGYETIRLAFLNSKGAYDYYNFTKKSVRKQQIARSPIKKNYGYTIDESDFADQFNLPIYEQGTYDGGTRTYNVNSIEIIEANTDFILEEEAAILEELFYSADVYMQNGERFEPVVISETEYIKQTSSNDKLIQYVIAIEKGHNTRVQRL